MSYIDDLKAELDGDVSRYGALSDAEVVASINTKNVSRDIVRLTGAQVWESTVFSEFNALTDSQKSQWLALTGHDNINPFGPAQQLAVGMFGGASDTIAALAAMRTELISRATELGFQKVRVGHVEMARAK